MAVKVQFPQLRERCEGDVATIAFLVDTVARVELLPSFAVTYALCLELTPASSLEVVVLVVVMVCCSSTSDFPRVQFPVAGGRVPLEPP